jgi:uncharacterized protein (DUF1330 family)
LASGKRLYDFFIVISGERAGSMATYLQTITTMHRNKQMSNAYVVGHLTVKNAEKWAEYRSRVPATLETWGGELVFRGKKAATLAGEQPHSDIVIVRFPDKEAVHKWFSSAAYQSLIPLREEAAEMVLVCYEA